ncbi:MAG TPA: sensor histidine kinase [Actinoplanes sp.]
MIEEAHRRYWPYWEIYFAVVAVAVVAATVTGDGHPLWRRETSAAAIAAMVVLHIAAGRRLINHDIEDWRNVVVAIGHLAFFVVTVAATPFTTWLLFAIIPLFFQLVPMRPAIVLVVLVNLVTPLVDVIEEPKLVPTDLVIGLISAAAGVWLGFWNIRVIEQSVERGQLIEELEASRAEVARLSHVAGVSAERARLAGEIHDTLAQGFTSIITLLQAAEPQLRDERVALAVRTAKENLAEARALVSDLSPAALAAGSLLDSVRRAATRFSEESGVPATVRVTGPSRRLPTSVEVVLLRATQEALANVRRHAGAGSAQVLLAFADDVVRLTVRDDGHGFTPGQADGFGLNGMRARAEQVNGTLTVASTTDDGTTIELEVPS